MTRKQAGPFCRLSPVPCQSESEAAAVRPSSLVLAATLVLLLDLQIETIATEINQYWVWLDAGPYYGVPTANFVAWWLVGLGMAAVVSILRLDNSIAYCVLRRSASKRYALRNIQYAMRLIPAYLYLLSTLMFAVVNLARGYALAGLVGVGVLLGVALRALWPLDWLRFQPEG